VGGACFDDILRIVQIRFQYPWAARNEMMALVFQRKPAWKIVLTNIPI
jgi:hypothetical protein